MIEKILVPKSGILLICAVAIAKVDDFVVMSKDYCWLSNHCSVSHKFVLVK